MARLNSEVLDNYKTLSKETLDNDKTLLVVVDMVKGFVQTGAMSDLGINDITNDIIKLCETYTHQLYFCDTHTKDSYEMDIFPPHCLKGTEEQELLDELKPYAKNQLLVEKNSTNGFMAPYFISHVEEILNKYDTFILTGCCTDICVLQFGLTLMGYIQQNDLKTKQLVMPLNAVDTYHNDDYHKAEDFNLMAVRLMQNAGIKIVKGIE